MELQRATLMGVTDAGKTRHGTGMDPPTRGISLSPCGISLSPCGINLSTRGIGLPPCGIWRPARGIGRSAARIGLRSAVIVSSSPGNGRVDLEEELRRNPRS